MYVVFQLTVCEMFWIAFVMNLKVNKCIVWTDSLILNFKGHQMDTSSLSVSSLKCYYYE